MKSRDNYKTLSLTLPNLIKPEILSSFNLQTIQTHMDSIANYVSKEFQPIL